jgi:MYXO-CTERM domain-containing protein
MRIATLLITLMVLVAPGPLSAQTASPDEKPAAEESGDDNAFVVPTEEKSEGEDEGARPATTRPDEEGEETAEDTEPVDTEPTMFTSCSQVVSAPAAPAWLLLLAFAGFVRRRV